MPVEGFGETDDRIIMQYLYPVPRLLDLFEDAGGNFIDTSNRYQESQSEEYLGTFLQTDRERMVVIRQPFLLVEGVLQHQDGVVSIRAERLQGIDGGASVDAHDFY